MESLQLLNNVAHAGLRMQASDHGPAPFVRIVTSEISAAAAACPILFSKHAETGRFYLGALIGLKPGENLLDSPDGRAAFRPLEADREGFFTADENIALDPDHPRFSIEDGNPLFEADGQPSAPLRAVQNALGRLVAGTEATEAFITALLSHRLIEPIDIALSFDDGETLRLDGLYTVSLDSLDDLDDGAVVSLFRVGHLRLAYAMAGSLQHVSLMARRRNDKLGRFG